MAVRRITRLVISALFLGGAVGVLTLAALLISRGPGGGFADAWLLAWSLLFATGLPATALVLTAAALFSHRDPPATTVPCAGRNIPRPG